MDHHHFLREKHSHTLTPVWYNRDDVSIDDVIDASAFLFYDELSEISASDHAPVVQWIEQGTSKPLMGVRFPPGVQKIIMTNANAFCVLTTQHVFGRII